MAPAESLAAAHAHMTPSEISDHARCLCEVIVSQEIFVNSLLDQLEQVSNSLAVRDASRRDIVTTLRQISNLYSLGRKRAAREMLHAAAAIEFPMDQQPAFDRSVFVPAAQAWPDIFNPKGSRQ